jgi:tetratricopeptide (TPR) repeat protein
LEDAIGTLFSFSLANRRETEDCFSIHTLVQTWARERLQKCDRQSFVEKAVLIVAGAAQKMVLEPTSDWAISRRLLAQVESCRKHLNHPLQDEETFRSTRAFSILGQLCDLLGHYDQATLWFEKDLNYVNCTSPLARLEIRDGIVTALLQKGQYTDALEGFRSVHATAKAELGIDHPLIYKIANSIGITCKNLNRYEEALSWYHEALRGVVQKFGDMDHRTLATLNNIAVVLKQLKRYSEALETYETVLSKKEMSLGKDHPSVLETVMNIGVVRMHCQQYEEALDLLQRALAGKEKIWGRDHPKTIDVLGNIANVYLEQGQAGQAVELYKEVLNGYEKVYGGMNLKVLSTAESLGDACYQQSCYMESLGWYKRALDGFKGIPDMGAFRVRLISQKLHNLLLKLGGYS